MKTQTLASLALLLILGAAGNAAGRAAGELPRNDLDLAGIEIKMKPGKYSVTAGATVAIPIRRSAI